MLIAIYQGVLTMYVVVNFGMATFMDPGVYPKGNLSFSVLMNFRRFWLHSMHCLLEKVILMINFILTYLFSSLPPFMALNGL